MESVERATARVLNLLGLSRIKSKIVVFSLLATLIPSVSMGWLTYRNNRRVLEEKIAQELSYRTTRAAQELDFWFRERSYEVRVFASSYEVSENLAKAYRGEEAGEGAELPVERLTSYLASVEQKFPDYEELLVVDPEGHVIASSRGAEGELDRPDDWLAQVSRGEFTVHGPYLDERVGAAVIPILQPVRDAENAVIGALVAKLDLSSIGRALAGERGLTDLYVVDRRGVVLVSAGAVPGGSLSVRLDPGVTARLFRSEGVTQSFTDFRGEGAVGMLRRAGPLNWGVVAEKPRAQAYARVSRLRNTTVAIVVTMLVVVGLVAYLLGMAIVRPLNRLTAAASKIASGDLNVQLPVYTRGELGYMTTVFNRMAARLRKAMGELDATNRELRRKNEELHRLSITDELTGLHNRKHMMETLAMEVARALRYDKRFSIMMIDIDDFKRYNDTYGHLAGDQVLRELGAFLRGSLRTEDYAARYGGEEFLLLLPETAAEGAGQLAERLRQRLEQQALGAIDGHDGITVSIGVAAFPINGTDPETLIQRADAAMYAAKSAGRNRVKISRARRKRAAN